MSYTYNTHGTCSRQITFDLDEEGKVHNVKFLGCCNGNLQGIAALVEGAAGRRCDPKAAWHQLQRQGHLLPGSAGKSH